MTSHDCLFTAIDDCSSNPCNNGGTCSDLKDDVMCKCQPGYSGKFCQIEDDECLSDPCYQGATCIDKVMHQQITNEDKFMILLHPIPGAL